MASPIQGEPYRSTQGKSAMELDSAEDEAIYTSLATASHGCYSVDQVRLIRRVFDRADKDTNGFVELHELEAMLTTIGDTVATRVMKDVLDHCQNEDGLNSWSFSAFVQMMRLRLSTDETLKLLTMEEDYIQSMGIDEEEQKDMESFRQNREVRRSSISLRPNEKPNNRLPSHHEHKPNDVDEYKHEFGFVSEDDSGSPLRK